MNFIYVLGIAIFIIVAVSVSIGLRERHVAKRRIERLCKKCGGPTMRRHLMIDASSNHLSRWFRRYFLTRTFNDCENDKCRHAECVKRGEKSFRLDQLALRHVWDHRQFTSDEDLLKRAGLIDDIVMPLSERMALVEEAARKKLKRIPIVPPPPELSVHARQPIPVVQSLAYRHEKLRKPIP
jgi:hypothetical protein